MNNLDELYKLRNLVLLNRHQSPKLQNKDNSATILFSSIKDPKNIQFIENHPELCEFVAKLSIEYALLYIKDLSMVKIFNTAEIYNKDEDFKLKENEYVVRFASTPNNNYDDYVRLNKLPNIVNKYNHRIAISTNYYNDHILCYLIIEINDLDEFESEEGIDPIISGS